MNKVLRFINVFKSPTNEILFNECACYWFANILKYRFGGNIMYNPQEVHFATDIRGVLYDINGKIEESEDYISWDLYDRDDRDMIIESCILL